jgi:hypothetical protein
MRRKRKAIKGLMRGRPGTYQLACGVRATSRSPSSQVSRSIVELILCVPAASLLVYDALRRIGAAGEQHSGLTTRCDKAEIDPMVLSITVCTVGGAVERLGAGERSSLK